MSILSGILSGGGLLMSALGAAIDSSHHPFKRATYRPGGPGGRADEESHQWECTKTRVPKGRGSDKTASAQRCVNIHNPDRKPKIVVINKAKKNAYNKKWRRGFKHKTTRVGRDPAFRRDVVAARAAWQPKKAKARRSRKSKR